ncbi:hypothetical protein J1605_005862 [Eschrichtius robustus]|uniref:Secreted protein n=1 Tax=Eschrichtius robustus TaxID=9764 RepID=A0AB34H6I4_ESCRO|nr:hypothetical protein J1605_005862 [Eschrichtius robustus]
MVPLLKVPMMHSATSATVSAATAPATSAPFAAAATANQDLNSRMAFGRTPWANASRVPAPNMQLPTPYPNETSEPQKLKHLPGLCLEERVPSDLE